MSASAKQEENFATEDLHLSEVHLETCPPGQRKWQTIFTFEVQPSNSASDSLIDSLADALTSRERKEPYIEKDEEGDLKLLRRSTFCAADVLAGEIVVHHHLATSFKDVGLQVWRGTLLLGDFVVALGQQLANITAVELGCGTGLGGILLSRVAKQVFLTDVADSILANTQENVAANVSISGKAGKGIRVKKLDWRGPYPWQEGFQRRTDIFGWEDEDLAMLGETRLLLAADVVVEADWTDTFLECSEQLMRFAQAKQGGQSPVLLMAAEKRFNFTLHDTDARAHAYEHFCSCIQHSEQGLPVAVQGRLIGQRVSVNLVPQSLHYDRGNDLEMWILKLAPC